MSSKIEGAASGGVATATVTGPATPDAAPEAAPVTEFPITLQEWAQPLQSTAWRTLVAGFLATQHDTTTTKLRAEWQAAFDAWCNAPA
jgi:hypothetical protein